MGTWAWSGPNQLRISPFVRFMSKHKQLPVKLMLLRQHTSCPTSGLESRMEFETLRSSQNTDVILISRSSYICDSTLGTVIQIPPFQIDDRLSSLKTIYLLRMRVILYLRSAILQRICCLLSRKSVLSSVTLNCRLYLLANQVYLMVSMRYCDHENTWVDII